MKKKSGLIAGIVILILLCIGAGVLYQNMKPGLLQLWMKKQRMIPNNNGGVSQKAENRSTLPQIRHQFLTEMHLSLH